MSVTASIDVGLEPAQDRRGHEIAQPPRGPPAAAPADRAAEPEEVFLELRYRDAVLEVITAQLSGDTLYLPVREIMGHLQVRAVYQPRDQSVRGFLHTETNRYAISVDSQFARVGATVAALGPADALAVDDDVYLRHELFARLFDLTLTLNWATLSLQLASTAPFPVLTAEQRRLRRAAAQRRPDAELPARVHARDRRPLAGAAGQYGLTLTGTSHGAAGALNLGAGFEVLGGDAELAVTGVVSTDVASLAARGHWRMVHDNPWLTQTTLGRMLVPSLEYRDIVGAQVTNQPIQPRAAFGNDSITGAAEPGWEVELYVNGRLTGFTLADQAGRYAFPLGLVYGSSIVELRLYGPSGEVRTETRRIQLPFVLLPRGEIEYRAAVGADALSGAATAAFQVSGGVHERATLRAGVDWVDDERGRTPTPFLAAYGLAAWNTVVGLEAAHGAFFRTSVESYVGASGQLGASHTRYGSSRLYNPRELDRQTQVRAFIPASLAGHPINMRVIANDATTLNGWRSRDLDAEAALLIERTRVMAGYGYGTFASLAYQSRIRVGASQYLSPRDPRYRRLVGSLFQAELSYDLLLDRIGSVAVEAGIPIRPRGRLFVGVDHDVRRGWGAHARFQLDRATFRSNTSARAIGGSGSVTQSLRGGIGYDSEHAELIFTDREWVGRAGAAIRLFIDANGNGVYDEGEQLVRGGAVAFGESLVVQADSSGIIRTTDLLAYHSYIARVRTGSIANPLWLPRDPSFRVDTDPNRYKTIDVPFYAVGVVEGYVRVQHNGATRPLGGIEVMLTSEDGTEITLRTFSDGSFYHIGLAVGKWQVSIDPDQLELLELHATPAVQHFVVRPTTDGDFVDGLEFLLARVNGPTPIQQASGALD